MKWLSDHAMARLREITEQPELTGTRYELVREVGRGGMGVVYEVRDRELERSVAMKVMDAEWRGEARIIAALEHRVVASGAMQWPGRKPPAGMA